MVVRQAAERERVEDSALRGGANGQFEFKLIEQTTKKQLQVWVFEMVEGGGGGGMRQFKVCACVRGRRE